jgi:single-strand DNA-binding protein
MPASSELLAPRPGEGADYVNVTVFGKLAKSCQQYLAKGRQISVQGRLAHREWTSKDGERRERHEVVAKSVTFLGQRPAQAAATDAKAA